MQTYSRQEMKAASEKKRIPEFERYLVLRNSSMSIDLLDDNLGRFVTQIRRAILTGQGEPAAKPGIASSQVENLDQWMVA
jgi:hypothetical protein